VVPRQLVVLGEHNIKQDIEQHQAKVGQHELFA
jgi:hypothetical protein